jgi:hypothetical protein
VLHKLENTRDDNRDDKGLECRDEGPAGKHWRVRQEVGKNEEQERGCREVRRDVIYRGVKREEEEERRGRLLHQTQHLSLFG